MIPPVLSSLRRPRFDVPGDGAEGRGGPRGPSLASYALLCRRRLLDDDHGNADLPDGEVLDVVSDEGSSVSSEARAGGGGGPDASTTGGDSGLDMSRCVSLLAPHLAAFRDGCRTVESGVPAEDEVPPQLLRVARFFRWRWEPLKRALLRSACADDDDDDDCGDQGYKGDSGGALAGTVEIGAAYRLRLANALRAGGLLSLAEVDGLAASFKRRGGREGARRQRHSKVVEEDGAVMMDGSPSKKRRIVQEHDDDENWKDSSLRSRLRMALSRLPSEASHCRDVSGSSRAKKGLRYADSVLKEWRDGHRSHQSSGGNDDGAMPFLPSADDVADWALTAFAGVVLANGIDYQRCRGGDDSDPGATAISSYCDVEKELARMMLAPISSEGRPEGVRGSDGGRGGLGLAIDARMMELMSPALVDDLSGIHSLTLARWFSYIPADVVEGYFASSISLCARECGIVGLMPLSKIAASYLGLVKAELRAPEFESRMRRKVLERSGPNDEIERCIDFLDLVLRTVKFMLKSAS